ncbi:MAG: hypothetical protein Q8Q60_00880 [Candidatus Chromulinivorax sp.]|nr:hypothetical protein [Candidatus Chromulinivorax sp.]
MQNKLLTFLIIIGFTHNAQIFSNETREALDKSVRYQETDDEKNASKCQCHCMWRQAAVINKYNFIEKPHWLTGDTIWERRIIRSSVAIGAFGIQKNKNVLFVEGQKSYGYWPLRTKLNNRVQLVCTKNYVRCPDDLTIDGRNLSKKEHRAIFVMAQIFAREHDKNIDQIFNGDHIHRDDDYFSDQFLKEDYQFKQFFDKF